MSLVNWLSGLIRTQGVCRRAGRSAAVPFHPRLEALGERCLPSAGPHAVAPLAPSSAHVSVADCRTEFTEIDELNPGGGGTKGTVTGTLAGEPVVGAAEKYVTYKAKENPDGTKNITDTLIITTSEGKIWFSETIFRAADTSLTGTATVIKGTGIYAGATGTLTLTRPGGPLTPIYYTGEICLAP